MRGRASRSFLVPLAAAAVLAGVAGCTMCPDPHDYSGPVPNGSAPQNDFRLRSNGILQVGGTPPPWPRVVKAGPARPQGEPAETPGVADAEPRVADAESPAPSSGVGSEDGSEDGPDIASEVVRLSAEEGAARGFVVDAGVDRGSVTSDDPAPDAAGRDTPVAVETEATPAAGDDRPVSVAEPALRETPGWRSRR